MLPMLPQPFYADDAVTLFHGDCLDVLRTLPDNSVDSVVTDPPYGLGFMGKAWDDLPPGLPWARECLRVLKPGGHMLAFGGTRTSHRLACAVEDAGFEIRDSIAWLYGSGFPKHRAALKPAFEPIVMARKPFGTSLEVNEAKYGTGALNIDGCRTDTHSGGPGTTPKSSVDGRRESMAGAMDRTDYDGSKGRWPANVVLDGSQADALDAQSGTSASKPEKVGRRGGTNAAPMSWDESNGDLEGRWPADPGGGASRFFPTFRYEAKAPTTERPRHGDTAHPTVKPLDLMRWLVRLVTPRGGTVLDMFAGSGTTGEACILEGFKCIAIEREADYLPLIVQRISKPLQVGLDLNFGETA